MFKLFDRELLKQLVLLNASATLHDANWAYSLIIVAHEAHSSLISLLLTPVKRHQSPLAKEHLCICNKKAVLSQR